jgi:hypothetical protein
MVHPGEEGNGRRLFPARNKDGRQQPACVRLTGNAGFYERCRLKQPWRIWAAAHEIPLPPADVKWEQVKRKPITKANQELKAAGVAYNETQMDAFRGLAEYNEHVGRQEAAEYRRRKAAGIPSDFDLAKQQYPELFESLRREEGLNAAPTSWPSLQGSSGVQIAYEGSAPLTQSQQAYLTEQQRRIDAAYAQHVVIERIVNAQQERHPAVPAPIYFNREPQPPPRLNLTPQNNISYGFTGATLIDESIYEEGGCSTPTLLPPVFDESLRPEGAMDAVD